MIKESIQFVTKLTGLSGGKLLLIAAIIAKLGGLYVWHYSEAKSAGYDQCVASQQEANGKLESEKLKKLQAEIAALKADQAKKEKAAAEAVETISNFKEKNQGLLDEIFELSQKPDACVFTDDFGGLLGELIGEAPSINQGN